MRGTLLLSVLAIAIGGCGDHGLPNPDMGTSADMSANVDMAELDMGINGDIREFVTFTMFAADYAQAFCAHALACGQLDAAQMAACIERNTLHTGWDQDVEIMKGHMEINKAQCLDALAKSACDQSDSDAYLTKCVQFLYLPHVANGSACLSSYECMSGSYCKHAGSDAGMTEQVTGCPGTCAPVKGTGESCRITSDCAADSYCNLIPGQPTTNTCLKLSALNEACTNTLGAGSGPPCQVGLNCPTFAASPTCSLATTQSSLHGACDPFQGQIVPMAPCAAGMYCQVQYTATTTACTGAAGANCENILGAYCDTTSGFCQAPSAGKCENKIASGMACNPNNEGFFSFAESQCVDGTTCYKAGTQTTTTCQPFGGANADCASDASCKLGLRCTSGKCTAWLADGQTCDPSTAAYCPSSPFASCVQGSADAGAVTTCEPVKNVGAACNPGFEDGLCADADLTGTSYCQRAGSAGVCAPKCF